MSMSNPDSAEIPGMILPHEKEIYEYVKTIEHLKKQSRNNPLFEQEIATFESKLEQLKQHVYKNLSAWERVLISRHPRRPKAFDFIKNITDVFEELSGDRCFGNDSAVIGGLAKIQGIPFVILGQEKGSDTESRLHRNFGMLHPEGFRKALRIMRLAEKLRLPIVSLIDTPGAYPGLEAEERGQGWAIAENLREMSRLQVPVIAIIIGEGCSGGALGMAVGNVVSMLEHAYYSVISPEGCASILWKDASRKSDAAAILKLTSDDLLAMKMIDHVIQEPLGGAHHDPSAVYKSVRDHIVEQWNILRHFPPALLREQRYLKIRNVGAFMEQG